MKTKLLTLALLIACSLGSFAQDKKDLQIRTQQMINLYNAADYNALFDFMYPKIFGVISKEDLTALMEKKMKGDGYDITMVRTDPGIDYGLIQRTDTSFYCLVTYNVQMKVGFSEKPDPKDKEATIERFKKILGVGDDEINYEEPSGVIHAKKRVQAMAIADESSYSIWTFVLLDGSKYVNEVLHEDMRKTVAEQ